MLRAAFNQKRIGPTDRKKLIAGIHAQAAALKLDDDIRRDMQKKLVGVESTKDMSLSQLSVIWSRLTTLASEAGLVTRHASRKRPGRDERQPAEPPTKEQLEKIEHLYADLGVRPSADMMALARRITGHPWPQNRAEANKLIEGMKAMRDRGWRARGSAPSVPDSTSVDQAERAGSRPAGRSNEEV